MALAPERSALDGLNEQQRQALLKAAAELRNGVPIVKLTGIAGTGKTFVAGALVDYLGTPRNEITGVACTHIATNRLRESLGGDIFCITIAALMKRAEQTKTGEASKLEKQIAKDLESGKLVEDSEEHLFLKRRVELLMGETFFLDERNKAQRLESIGLLIIDELSQISHEEREFLDEHMGRNMRIIALGDEFQIPPIDGDPGAFDDVPSAGHLTQVMRGDGSIAAFAAPLREGPCGYDDGTYGGVTLATKQLKHIPDLWWQRIKTNCDCVIAPTHWQRAFAIRKLRRLGYLYRKEPDAIVEGDKLLVRARFGKFNNGEILTVGRELLIPQDGISAKLPKGYARLIVTRTGDGVVFPLSMLKWPNAEIGDLNFHGHNKYRLMARAEASEFNRDHNPAGEAVSIFEYGQAITIHSSQGCEFDNVTVLYGGWPSETFSQHGLQIDGLEARRVLYTAITRAKTKLWLIRSSPYLLKATDRRDEPWTETWEELLEASPAKDRF